MFAYWQQPRAWLCHTLHDVGKPFSDGLSVCTQPFAPCARVQPVRGREYGVGQTCLALCPKMSQDGRRIADSNIFKLSDSRCNPAKIPACAGMTAGVAVFQTAFLFARL
ncbi:hypothetical protein [Kingella potus]|uniref:hypothetical protein n=1 Tax=Kingella potus TaxID=265175 RepID=UPI001FD2C0B3|nr:hypothetical protein [Kingella potus]UOP00807.1 hypothetical protein LVJ84_13835 [Kingella potus]